jgi:hypothetical protein
MLAAPCKQKLLTDPLSPQPLDGEETVERREWSNRVSLLFNALAKRENVEKNILRDIGRWQQGDQREGRLAAEVSPANSQRLGVRHSAGRGHARHR